MHRTPSAGGLAARVMRGAALRRFVTVLTVLGMMLSFLPGGLSYPSASQAQEQGAGGEPGTEPTDSTTTTVAEDPADGATPPTDTTAPPADDQTPPVDTTAPPADDQGGSGDTPVDTTTPPVVTSTTVDTSVPPTDEEPAVDPSEQAPTTSTTVDESAPPAEEEPVVEEPAAVIEEAPVVDVTEPTVTYLVKFAPGAKAQNRKGALDANGAKSTGTLALGIELVDFPASTHAAKSKALAKNPNVLYVEENSIREAAAFVMNDTNYAGQWSLPKIGWDLAYEVVPITGSATVAVLDTGIDAGHADMGTLVAGTSFVDGADPLVDPNGHGTALAGIVGASTGNNLGIAAVGYAGVKLMPVTVLAADGTGTDADIVAGVVWAADHGADVILMGFSNPGFSQALQDAADYAWSQGAVLVAATGNDGSSTPTYPAGMAARHGGELDEPE